MKYLLDTCVVSDFFKKEPNTIRHFKKTSVNEIAISTMTISEIEYGLKLRPEREIKLRPIWDAFLEEIAVLPFDSQEALCAAILRARLKSNTIGAYDYIIAGTALAHNIILVTSNMREFVRLTGLINLEDWRE